MGQVSASLRSVEALGNAYSKADVELFASESEAFRHSSHGCIANVAPVHEGCEVEKREHWQDAEVDFSTNLAHLLVIVDWQAGGV